MRAVVCLLLLVLAACAPYEQGGSPGLAAQAANSFLNALSRGESIEAWSHLTPATQQAAYGGNRAAFAADVEATDWSHLAWEIGPITNHDISWGVNVELDESSIPGFLIEKEIVAGWDGFGMVILVQVPIDEGDYYIAAQGLDTRLETSAGQWRTV